MIFFRFKMAAISQNLEQLGPNFPQHSRTTQGMCVQNIDHRDFFQIEGDRFGTKIQEHILDLTTAAAATLNLSNTYIGPTLHVGTNKAYNNSIILQIDVVSMTETVPETNLGVSENKPGARGSQILVNPCKLSTTP